MRIMPLSVILSNGLVDLIGNNGKAAYNIAVSAGWAAKDL